MSLWYVKVVIAKVIDNDDIAELVRNVGASVATNGKEGTTEVHQYVEAYGHYSAIHFAVNRIPVGLTVLDMIIEIEAKTEERRHKELDEQGLGNVMDSLIKQQMKLNRNLRKSK